MSSAPVRPHGFVTVRGRGYRPVEVDAGVAALSAERDAAWERAARLTVLAREMEEELADLREEVAGLAPQTYETLGEPARDLFRQVEREAAALREAARAAGGRLVEEALAYGRDVREAARAHADAVHAEADEGARQRLLAARAEADEMRIACRREVKAGRGESLAALRGTRQRVLAIHAEQAREHAARWAQAEREQTARAAAVDARLAELLARAAERAAEAERGLAAAEESARRTPEQARARAAETIAEARAYEERIARETERVLREHGERWDVVQAQMDEVRGNLSELTGRAVE
ncbi:cellulose-binding protein [Streptomyces ziwulingensis]|uniref:Cellulose-binding protein n=1 Tax=Streptomyces ziwulingensis TaxID=1045501 RepID=A0ABP9C857_9ACTN